MANSALESKSTVLCRDPIFSGSVCAEGATQLAATMRTTMMEGGMEWCMLQTPQVHADRDLQARYVCQAHAVPEIVYLRWR